jgi:hypothetical protein
VKKCLSLIAIFVISLSLIFGGWAMAEESTRVLWPSSLVSTQWYWSEPDFTYSVEKIKSDLKALLNSPVSIISSAEPKNIIGPGKITMEFKEAKSGPIPMSFDLHKPDMIYGLPNLERYFYNNMLLLYYSYDDNLWYVKCTQQNATNNYMMFQFANEGDARKFESILASSCKLAGFTLSLPKIGFIVDNLTPAQAEALGKTRLENVLVTLIAIDDPAGKTIKVSDVITEVIGVWVKNASHFNALINAATPGSIVKLTCLERIETSMNGQKKTEWKEKTIDQAVR